MFTILVFHMYADQAEDSEATGSPLEGKIVLWWLDGF
jgi:hypothetical protein